MEWIRNIIDRKKQKIVGYVVKSKDRFIRKEIRNAYRYDCVL